MKQDTLCVKAELSHGQNKHRISDVWDNLQLPSFIVHKANYMHVPPNTKTNHNFVYTPLTNESYLYFFLCRNMVQLIHFASCPTFKNVKRLYSH